MMKDTYEPCGAKIFVYGEAPAVLSSRQLFWEWHNALPVGAEYNDSDIRKACRTTAIRLRDWYKEYKDIQKVLEHDRLPNKRMLYRKGG